MLKLALPLLLILSSTRLKADLVNLTGLYLFGADSSGNDVPPDAAYTGVPNNGTYVLWTAEGDYNAPLLNGPDRDHASISVPLSTGSQLFSVFTAAGISEGQAGFPGPIPPYVGLNLFFNDETETPGISVLAPTNFSAVGPFPAFSANSGSTLDLSGTQNVPGAGSLTFESGGYMVTLSGFLFSEPLVYNLDRISNFDNSPDGNRDFVGQFTLEVAAVPEPSSLLLLGTLLVMLAASLTRRRAGKNLSWPNS